MHAMPAHSSGARRSSKTPSTAGRAITGIANMLSDAVPAGSKRSTSIHDEEACRRGDHADVERAASTCGTLHCVGGTSRNQRQQRQRQHADQHLPRDEVQHVERCGRAGSASTRRVPAAQPNPDRTAHRRGARSPCQSQGATSSDEPGERERDRRATGCRARARRAPATRSAASRTAS